MNKSSKQKLKDMKHWLFYYQVHKASDGKFVGRYSYRQFAGRLYPVPMTTAPRITENDIIDDIYNTVYTLAMAEVELNEY